MTPSSTLPNTASICLSKLHAMVAVYLACLGAVSLWGGSIRVNGQVVETGMSKGKAMLLLGEPDWRVDYLLGDIGNIQRLGDPIGLFSDRSGIAGYSGGVDLLGPVAVEEWLFDQGENRLMQLLRFEDQRLVSIKSLGYGFGDQDRRKRHQPDWAAVQVGDTSYELVQRMGEPSVIEDQPQVDFVRIYGPYRNTLHFRSARVSWWYYNWGQSRLFRIVKMVNGRVIEVVAEGRGVD